MNTGMMRSSVFVMMTMSLSLLSVSCGNSLQVKTLADITNTQSEVATASTAKQVAAVDVEDRRLQSYIDYAENNQGATDFVALQRLAELKYTRWKQDSELAEGDSDQTISEVIQLYNTIRDQAKDYPDMEQVLYDLSRAYLDSGDAENGHKTLNTLMLSYPHSDYAEESYLRLAEYAYLKKHYRVAVEHYTKVIELAGQYQEIAYYKRGWSHFKSSRYPQALTDFIAALESNTAGSHYVATSLTDDKADRKALDIYRVIVTTLSYDGGVESIEQYFSTTATEKYNRAIYMMLAEYYLESGRTSDAAEVYASYIATHTDSEHAPYLQKRIIEIYSEAGFSEPMLAAMESYVERYRPDSRYWSGRDKAGFKDVHDDVRSSTRKLAGFYNVQREASAKQPDATEIRRQHKKAKKYYSQYLHYYTQDNAKVRYQFAQMLFDDRRYALAREQFRKVVATVGPSELAADAAYAVVYCSDRLRLAASEDGGVSAQRYVDDALAYLRQYPEHSNAVAVARALVQSVYAAGQYELAITVADEVIRLYKQTPGDLIILAYTIKAHSQFETHDYPLAEETYEKAIRLQRDAQLKAELKKNLAAARMQHSEQLQQSGHIDEAITLLLSIGTIMPGTEYALTADHRAAILLSQQKKDDQAESLWREVAHSSSDRLIRSDAITRLALLYQQQGRAAESASMYQRLAESADTAVIRNQAQLEAARQLAASDEPKRAIRMYHVFLKNTDVSFADRLNARLEMAKVYWTIDYRTRSSRELESLIADEQSYQERDDTTAAIAADAAMLIADRAIEKFERQRLDSRLARNLPRKKQLMRSALKRLNRVIEYNIGELTAAATFKIAGVYEDFGKALLTAEKPAGLSAFELEQYMLRLEEQVYSFEEKSISIHRKNIELISLGVYNVWTDKSLARLAAYLPAEFDRQEQNSDFIRNLDVGDWQNSDVQSYHETTVGGVS